MLLNDGFDIVPTVTAPVPAGVTDMLVPAVIEVTPVLANVIVLPALLADKPVPADNVIAGPTRPLIAVTAAVR